MRDGLTRIVPNLLQNTYLISINITNKLKEKYYYEYVPELLDLRMR